MAIIRILNLFLSFANYQRIKMSIMLSIIWSTSPFNLVSLIKLRCINATNFRDLYLRIYVLCVFVYGEQTKNIIKFSLHVLYMSLWAHGDILYVEYMALYQRVIVAIVYPVESRKMQAAG